MPLDVGKPAPEISAPNQDGETVSPSFDDPTVVYFYPEDDTSGCTTEATQFDAERDTYSEAGVEVYGVSADDVESHRAFAGKHGLDVELLADPDGAVADAFDVDRGPDGRTARTTFVLVDDEVYSVYDGVDPDGHAREVLQDLLDADLVELDW